MKSKYTERAVVWIVTSSEHHPQQVQLLQSIGDASWCVMYTNTGHKCVVYNDYLFATEEEAWLTIIARLQDKMRPLQVAMDSAISNVNHLRNINHYRSIPPTCS